MKEEAQQPWEAEVRRVVETHEFEYDPAAWAGMEHLLEQTTPTGGQQGVKWWVKAWRWLLPSVALLIIGAIWFSRPAEPPSIQGSLPIATESATPNQTETTVNEIKTADVVSAPVIPAKQLPAKQVTIQSTQERQISLPPLQQVVPTALKPLPFRSIKPLEYQERQKDNIPEIDIKRKRNRKALFPDVIKNY